jgi:hypothetical protein
MAPPKDVNRLVDLVLQGEFHRLENLVSENFPHHDPVGVVQLESGPPVLLADKSLDMGLEAACPSRR